MIYIIYRIRQEKKIRDKYEEVSHGKKKIRRI